ncbi:hypothetical protein [Spiroplasma endosymbiont of Nebria brevicollis]|uniref:hypothetical protein n=1 Tax=Spiroplasma endosymbiont of Nebria brevicollis TaxID=3066284 RepID=UPI00313AC722
MQTQWWKLQKGTGIKVKLNGDIDKNGKQKIRPGIIIKSYPSHIKVQLFSTEKSKDTYFSIVINGKLQHIRAIYHKTILFTDVHSFWFERGSKVSIEKDSVFFEKIIEMEHKEIFEKPLDLSFQHKLEKVEKQKEQLIVWIKNLQEENLKLKEQLKNQIRKNMKIKDKH